MKKWLSLLLGALLLTSCGMAPALSSDVEGSYQADSNEPQIEVAFNDTYLERNDLNEPRAKANSTNTDKGLLRLIRNAKQSIDGAFYDIEDLAVTQELILAHQRGVKIRLVTDTDNMVEKSDPTVPRAAIVKLHAEGIPIVEDQRSGIMHHKFMVVDKLRVWMGSTNLTPTSLYRHNNNALTLRSGPLAKAFLAEFELLFEKHAFGKSARGKSAPTHQIRMNNGLVQAYFSPAGGGRDAVVKELQAAKKRIRFMTFSLTDLETGETMLEKAKTGVKVQGIFDRWLAAGEYSLFTRFKDEGIDVWRDGNEALMHHKIILIDDEVIITGSYNYSKNAEDNNNEAFLIIRRAPALVKSYDKEFDRLLYAAKHNRPPAFKGKDAEHKTGDVP